jgi:hypothetical protein
VHFRCTQLCNWKTLTFLDHHCLAPNLESLHPHHAPLRCTLNSERILKIILRLILAYLPISIPQGHEVFPLSFETFQSAVLQQSMSQSQNADPESRMVDVGDVCNILRRPTHIISGQTLSSRNGLKNVMKPVTINGNYFDPAVHSAERGISENSTSSHYILIQMSSAPTDEQETELELLGAVMPDEIADDTYLYGYQQWSQQAGRRGGLTGHSLYLE